LHPFDLVPGTLEVYPIAHFGPVTSLWRRHFGAVEIGVHRFHHPGHEDTEPVGEAKFIHLWQNQDGAWKLTRIISFDHHALAK
jgi:hypothetical protein